MKATPADLAAFPGRGVGEDSAHAQKILEAATLMVRAYTRGHGFVPNSPLEIDEPELLAVVLSSAARLGANPTFTQSMTVDDATIRNGTFDGWTLPELAILHTYRRRTA